MSKIAIIGTGISGLAAAYRLSRHHDIAVYEKEHRVGGHTRTMTVHHGDREIPVDTGFIVYNTRNYPNLTALFGELDVPVQDSDMSFALTVGDGWLEWGAHSLDAIYGQRRNIVRPLFYRLFSQVMRFNARAVRAAAETPDLSLGELVARMGFDEDFRRYYLLPMAGAIWSCPPRQMLDFPAASFVRFFDNHGLLSVSGQPQWKTVSGGSQTYVDRMTRAFADRIRTDCAVTSVRRENGRVRVHDRSGGEDIFDHVVFASHADETLAMLADPTTAEREALGAFSFQPNRAWLHKNPRYMPKRRRCWASWVYHAENAGDEPAITISYWMNRLQSIDRAYPLFVTLNPKGEIPAEDVFDVHDFSHPVFDARAVAAQPRMRALQGRQNTWFCGAWLGYGFHEDGLSSAIAVTDALERATKSAPHPESLASRTALATA
jgi:predicted NAD/FAD-binding protein